MPACLSCGETNPERARFCLGCGLPLTLTEPGREARKTVTILFSDLKGSTALGERTDPETVRSVMTRYFAEMQAIITRHGGVVEKFIGDAIMAVFGLPVVHEDDALRAVRAALEMCADTAGLNDELDRLHGVRLEVRTGVNTGEVVAGDAATGQLLVTGDAVNVAARLEQAAATGEILIGPETERLVRARAMLAPVVPLTLKGKRDPLSAFQVVGLKRRASTPDANFGTPLVGRERELALLTGAYERVRHQRKPHLALVVGDAGVGKSRLVEGFLGAVAPDAHILRGRCLPYGEGITFWPVRELLVDAARIADDDPADIVRAKLSTLLSSDPERSTIVERLLGAMGLSDLAAQQHETFWAVRRLLAALAGARPVVAVFDDVQWGEDGFLDLLELLATADPGGPVLLLCLARPELCERRDVVGAAGASVVAVGPLDEQASRRLLEQLLGGSAAQREIADHVHRTAAGNPLFLIETLRMLVDEGRVQQADGGWTVEGLRAASLPPTIQALLAARLDRLSPNERRVLDPASVIGEEFWRQAVHDLCLGVVADEVEQQLLTLVDKHLVRPVASSLAGEDAYRFDHLLLRDAAYAGLLKRVRAELHEHFADWLERRIATRLAEFEEIVGYHLERAFRYREELAPLDDHALALARRAAQRLAASGRRALLRGDMAASVNLLRRARALVPAGESVQLELSLSLADVLAEQGRFAEAKQVVVEAEQAAQRDGEEALAVRARVQRLLITMTTSPVRSDELLEATTTAVPVLERAGDDDGLARAWVARAECFCIVGRYGEAETALEHGLRHARRAGDRRTEAYASPFLAGMAIFGPRPLSVVVPRLEAMLVAAEGQPYVEAVCGLSLANLDAMRGRFDDARRELARNRAVLRELGATLQHAVFAQAVGLVEILAGDPAAAEPQLRASCDTLGEMGETAYLSTNAAYLAEVLLLQDREDEAYRFTEVSAEAAAVDDTSAQAGWRQVRARVHARRGRLIEARELAEEAVSITQATDALNQRGETLMALAEVLRVAGDRDAARVAARRGADEYAAKENLVAERRARVVTTSLE